MLRQKNLVELTKGFKNADVYITEASYGKRMVTGSCVLLQNPATWGKKDTEPRRWLVTAAHCVCRYTYGKITRYEEIRIRAPKWNLWDGFPESKEIKNGPLFTYDYYESIPLTKNQIIVHPKYDGTSTGGYDIALIAIPPRPARDQCLNFNMILADTMPSSICASGYPLFMENNQQKSHIPYYISRERDEDEEEESDDENGGGDAWELKFIGETVNYPLNTQKGISGGAFIIEDQIVGIHNAHDDQELGRAVGTFFSSKVKKWINQNLKQWEPIMNEGKDPFEEANKLLEAERMEEERKRLENERMQERLRQERIRQEAERKRQEEERRKLRRKQEEQRRERERLKKESEKYNQWGQVRHERPYAPRTGGGLAGLMGRTIKGNSPSWW